MNKHERNAVEVALSTHIDSLIDLRSYFELPITFEIIVGLGDWALKLIKTHLEYEIEGIKECMLDSDDNEEYNYFNDLLDCQQGALKAINKAIKYNEIKKRGNK